MGNFVKQVREHTFYPVDSVDSCKDFEQRNEMIWFVFKISETNHFGDCIESCYNRPDKS